MGVPICRNQIICYYPEYIYIYIGMWVVKGSHTGMRQKSATQAAGVVSVEGSGCDCAIAA